MGCLTPCDIAAVNQERESWESLITSDRRYTRLSVASAFLAALFVHIMLREAITHCRLLRKVTCSGQVPRLVNAPPFP